MITPHGLWRSRLRAAGLQRRVTPITLLHGGLAVVISRGLR
jgi:hypothetical protein